MSKIKSTFEKNINTTRGKIAVSALIFLILYIIYSSYIWVTTQSTDNAYLENNVTVVAPEVSGKFVEINFIENQKVKKGDILFKIEDTIHKSIYESSLSEVNALEAQFESSKNGLKIAEHELVVAKVALENAEKNYNREKSLRKDNYISKQNIEIAVLKKKEANAKYNIANLAVENAKYNIEVTQNNLDRAKWNSSGVNGEGGASKFNYENTIVKAPIDGYVTSSSVRLGSFARQGFPVLHIVPLDGMYVKANFKETQVANFREGMKAHIKFDGLSGIIIEGKIRNLYPATGSKFSLIPTDNATGNFTKIVQKRPVIIDIEIPEKYKNKLAVGYSAHVSIRTNQ